MRRAWKAIGILFVAVVILDTAARADAVTLAGETLTDEVQGMLTLKSAQGVELEISFLKDASAITGAESGVSVKQVRIDVMSVPAGVTVRNGVFAFSTTCTRIVPADGSPFVNQESQDFQLTFGPHQLPEAIVPLAFIVLQKNVHGGEFHTCEANLAFTINGAAQVDPVNRTTTFHPLF